MYNILQLAMDFQKSPSSYGDLIDPAKPLPENIDILLEVAAGEVESSTINNDVAVQESISHELLSAASFFVEHALFIPKGNHYRTLGVETDASQEQIRKHFHLLNKLLYLDREDKSDEWNTSYAMRINHAYSILRDPDKRRSYDHILNKQGIQVVTSDKHYARSPDNEATAASDSSRAALADLLTSYKESHRDKPAVNQPAQPAADSVPESRPAKVSYIAGNIDKAHVAANGRSKPTGGAQNQQDGSVTQKKPKEARKEPVSRQPGPKLSSEELDSFQQLIRTQPTQRNKLFALARDNAVGYRWVTVGLSVALLVVVVIYVFQQMSGDKDVLPELAQVQPPVATVPDADSETTPTIELPVEKPLTELLEEEAADDKGKPTGSPAAIAEKPLVTNTDTDTRRRRTIEVITAGDTADTTTKERASDKKVATRTSTPVKETTKPQTARIEKAPSRPVSSESSASIKEVPVKKKEPQQTPAGEKTNARQIPEKASPVIVAGKKPAPDIVPVQPDTTPVSRAPQTAQTPTPQKDDQASGFDAEGQVPPLSGAATFVSMAPPQVEKPINNNISDHELRNFIADFIRSYEGGDLPLFMNLFAEDARTQDQNTRQGIRKDYQELFQGTEKRQFIIDNLQWKKEDDNRAIGEGDFKVIVQAPGDPTLNSFLGKVTFKVQKGPQGIVIKQLEHTYGASGTE